MANFNIAGLVGEAIAQGTPTYNNANHQYATSSYGAEHDMNPGLIVKPTSTAEIGAILRHAKANGQAVAIRTGGHQLSGASSTNGSNILIDLKTTFRGAGDRVITLPAPGGSGKELVTVRTSVSYANDEMSDFLSANGLFLPQGLGGKVHLGGHVQTGGYGMLIRTFGLFGDHVTELEIVNHLGNVEIINKVTDAGLFGALLGGSPGNLGVITHFTLKVHRDADYVGSKCIKALHGYTQEKLQRFLTIAAAMSDNPNTPQNYELCIKVLSSRSQLHTIFHESTEKLQEAMPEANAGVNDNAWPRSIVVYASWIPLNVGDTCDPVFFSQFTEGAFPGFGELHTIAVSKMQQKWMVSMDRDFENPYVKRTYTTKSTTLTQDKWSEWVADRIDTIVAPELNGCAIAAQFQMWGGVNSQLLKNANNGTSYSWRDATFGVSLDCFHEVDSKRQALDWQKVNDMEGVGLNGKFSKVDLRLLWGSYGSFDLDASWPFYYENKAKYEKLQAVRARVDPDGLFTPNSFCVKRTETARLSLILKRSNVLAVAPLSVTSSGTSSCI
jgi:hypothetical protein